MNLFSSLTKPPPARRSGTLPLGFGEWMQQLAYGPSTTMATKREEIGGDYRGYIDGAFKNNGVVFACMTARSLLFTEARFQWRQLKSGRPGDYFGTNELSVLEQPWPNGQTGDLLAAAIQDVDLAGNFYAVRRPDNTLFRMRPDWVTIALGSPTAGRPRPGVDPTDFQPGDLDTRVIGYLYHPGGPHSSRPPIPFLPESVIHWAPIKDPAAWYRGMSWITPIVSELLGDNASNEHKLKFFEQGASPNMVISLDPAIQAAQFREWEELFRAQNEGLSNAYSTMLLGGGADVKVVGSDFKQIDFAVTQGHAETRVCAAARVPPIIVGMSEGLAAATYSNYGMARRAFADLTMRPLWRTFANAVEQVMTVPPGTQLWYDDRDVAFLQEDQTDAAAVQSTQAATINGLISAGFEPAVAVGAVMAGDLGRLKDGHTGLVSVQLLPPGEQPTPAPAAAAPAEPAPSASPNGNGSQPAPTST